MRPPPLDRPVELSSATVRTRGELDRLAAEWNELLVASSACTVFLTWEWIQAWLEAIRPDARLRVVSVRSSDGRLAAIGPFYEMRLFLGRVVPFRCLRVLGDAPGGSEYGNVIARSDVEAVATQAVFQCLASHPDWWDAIWIPNMGPTAGACAATERAVRSLGMKCRSRDVDFSRISLPTSFEGYLKCLPGKTRYQFRTGLDRLTRKFGASLVTCREKSELSEALADLFGLHGARWSHRGRNGVFADKRMQRFYQALGTSMMERGRLRLDRLYVGGRAVAAQLGLVFGDVFSELQRGFDPTFPNFPAGLGAGLRSMVLKRCIDHGVRTYDFLGGHTDDKLRAGAEPSIGRDLLIVRPSMKNFGLFASRTWPTGRYLRFAAAGMQAAHSA